MSNLLSASVSEFPIAAHILGGNPDVVKLSVGFQSSTHAQFCKDTTYMATRDKHGSLSAEAFTRLAVAPAGFVCDHANDGASALLRAVSTVHRPSGRAVGVVVAHLALKAERLLSPEGSYIVIRICNPTIHSAGQGDKSDARELTTGSLMAQAAAMCQQLVETVRELPEDCVIWNLPPAARDSKFLMELSATLCNNIHGPRGLDTAKVH